MKDVIAFGEVLWDVIEGVPNIGGAPFNFAAHARRCGMSTALISAIGPDDLGRRAREMIRREGVDDSCVFVSELPTGTVEVKLDKGMPVYEIKKPVAWDRIVIPDEEALPVTPRVFYHGTLAARDEVSYNTLESLLTRYAQSLVFYDVNLRQDFWSEDVVRHLLGGTDILKLNEDEVVQLGFSVAGLFDEFPRLKMVVVTRGADGCDVSVRGSETYHSDAIPAGPVVDTVGAGDAFSAAFIAEILRGRSPREAAEAGNRRGGWVASKAGAIPDCRGWLAR